MFNTVKTILRLQLRSRWFAAAAVMAALCGVWQSIDMKPNSLGGDTDAFMTLPYIIAAFCAILPAALQRSGGMRNILITGVRKTQVFMAELIGGLVSMLLIFAAMCLTMFIFAREYFMQFDADMLLRYFGFMLTGLAVISTVTTVISALCRNEATALIISLLLLSADMLFVSMAHTSLYHPEYSIEERYAPTGEALTPEEADMLLETGDIIEAEGPNRFYVGGAERKILWVINSLDPMTAYRWHGFKQMTEYGFKSNQELEETLSWYEDDRVMSVEEVDISTAYRLPLCALGIIVLSVSAGAMIIRKKNVN